MILVIVSQLLTQSGGVFLLLLAQVRVPFVLLNS
jgi:hypothetical protein